MAEVMVDTPQSPGSLKDFSLRHPELSSSEATAQYTLAGEEYRDALARYYGVTREELHQMRFRHAAEAVLELAQSTEASIAS